jgi:lipoprotein-releasing system ATP-binding protein
MTMLEAVGLSKTYRGGDGGELTVLDGLDLAVASGEIVAIVGASGSGKSTLLNLLGGLDRPTRGVVRVGGQALIAAPPSAGAELQSRIARWRAARRSRAAQRRSDEVLSGHRNKSIGFVFQFHHLLREFSAVENVMMPLLIGGWDPAKARPRAESLLERVGLAGRMSHRPSELSGGEQQRTAVARALAASPAVLLADEPSGNLDHANSERLHSLLVELARDFDIAMVVVTHNRALARRAHRTLLLEDGMLREANIDEVVAS